MNPTARRFALIAVTVALGFWAVRGILGTAPGIAVGTKAPELRLILDEGRVYSLGTTKGEVLVLNFWASWCEPCRIEAPILSGLRGPGTEVVGVGIEDLPLSELSARARAMGVRYPVAADRSGLSRDFAVRAVPTTYVLASDGTVVYARSGLVGKHELERAIGEARRASAP